MLPPAWKMAKNGSISHAVANLIPQNLSIVSIVIGAGFIIVRVAPTILVPGRAIVHGAVVGVLIGHGGSGLSGLGSLGCRSVARHIDDGFAMFGLFPGRGAIARPLDDLFLHRGSPLQGNALVVLPVPAAPWVNRQ